MKQSAVEYLIRNLEILNLIKDGDLENELFRQIELEAKQTEKEIITEAYSQGRIDEKTRFPYAIDGEDYFKLEFTQSSECNCRCNCTDAECSCSCRTES